MITFIAGRPLRRGSLHKSNFVALFAALFLGCAVNPVTANAMTPQPIDQSIAGKFVWHDLFTHDLESSSQFYEKLFGWSFVNSLSGDTKVKRIYSGENHIGNAIEIEPLKQNISESQWLSYMSVEDVDDAVKRIEVNKGVIQIPARELPQRGRVAVCLDSQEAVFAIIKTREGDTAAQQAEVDEAELNSWLGCELWTKNTDAASDFYGNIVGYNMQTIKMGNGEIYQVFMGDGQARAGIVKIPFDDVQPNWVPYIAVKDTMAVSDKVLELGGQLLTEPDRDLPENAAVIIADPSGVVFGIQQVVLVGSGEGDIK